MGIDLTKLNGIAAEGAEMPPEEQSTSGECKDLQRQADAQKLGIDRSLSIYQKYQKNTRLSASLQTEILKGIKGGEDIYSLFLKAAKAIAAMTANEVFYTQVEADIKTIYGVGLLQETPLQMELESTKERLQRLLDAEKVETQAASKERIAGAIKAHRARVSGIESLIKKEKTE